MHQHQHQHQHAFAPILHQSLTFLPAPMYNTQLPRAATQPSFAPVAAIQRATQTTFRSPVKPWRCGALHVSIAWKIYYHKKLKEKQQKSSGLLREVSPECFTGGFPEHHKESEPSSCLHPNTDSSCGRSAHATNETGSLSDLDRRLTSDLYTASPASCRHATKRGRPETPHDLHRNQTLAEMEKRHGAESRDLTATPDLDRKRQLECDGSVRVKRVKQEVVDEPLQPSTFLHPSYHAMQRRKMSHVPVVYLNSCDITRAPEMHPNPTASWEPVWDLHCRQNILKRYSLKSWRGTGMPPASCGFYTQPLQFPHALRQLETVHLRGEELLDSHHHHLQHPGYLAASYLGP